MRRNVGEICNFLACRTAVSRATQPGPYEPESYDWIALLSLAIKLKAVAAVAQHSACTFENPEQVVLPRFFTTP